MHKREETETDRGAHLLRQEAKVITNKITLVAILSIFIYITVAPWYLQGIGFRAVPPSTKI